VLAELLIDERVDEALRATATVAAGPFRSLGHTTAGRAVALELADGRRFLRLEELRTSDGPDMFVYLSTAVADAQRDTFDDDFLCLGRLKANQGSQNYSIAAGASLDRYRSAVIWCRRFTYAFGAAALG
jgi:Electron transfer DM13